MLFLLKIFPLNTKQSDGKFTLTELRLAVDKEGKVKGKDKE